MHGRLKAAVLVLVMMSGTAFAGVEDWQNSYRLEREGKYADALGAIAPVPANGPDAELKTLRRGWLYYLTGSYNESIREYRYAVERNPHSIDALLGETLPLLAQKRWREAEQVSKDALAISPNHYTALLRLSQALEGERNWPGMEQAASSLANHYPSDATAFLYLARAHAWQGHNAEAAAAYRAVLVRYPDQAEAASFLSGMNGK